VIEPDTAKRTARRPNRAEGFTPDPQDRPVYGPGLFRRATEEQYFQLHVHPKAGKHTGSRPMAFPGRLSPGEFDLTSARSKCAVGSGINPLEARPVSVRMGLLTKRGPATAAPLVGRG
jgi:hypothetical protein